MHRTWIHDTYFRSSIRRRLLLQVVLPDVHRTEMDAVVFLPPEHAADDADTAEQRGAVAALQQVLFPGRHCCETDSLASRSASANQRLHSYALTGSA